MDRAPGPRLALPCLRPTVQRRSASLHGRPRASWKDDRASMTQGARSAESAESAVVSRDVSRGRDIGTDGSRLPMPRSSRFRPPGARTPGVPRTCHPCASSPCSRCIRSVYPVWNICLGPFAMRRSGVRIPSAPPNPLVRGRARILGTGEEHGLSAFGQHKVPSPTSSARLGRSRSAAAGWRTWSV